MECITHRRHSPYNRRRCRRCIYTHMIFNHGTIWQAYLGPLLLQRELLHLPKVVNYRPQMPHLVVRGVTGVRKHIMDMRDLAA